METFTLSPTLSHLNGWEKKYQLTEWGTNKSVSFHKSVFVCDALLQSRYIFVQTLHSRFLSQCMKRVLRFHMYCYHIQWFLSEVICWNASIWSALPRVCVFVHVWFTQPFSSSDKLKYTFSDVVHLALPKGLQWLHCRIRHVTVRLDYTVIIHIIIQFPHTDSCAWT